MQYLCGCIKMPISWALYIPNLTPKLNYGGTGGPVVKTRALDLELHCSSPTSVRASFSFPFFNLNALEFTQLYPIK